MRLCSIIPEGGCVWKKLNYIGLLLPYIRTARVMYDADALQSVKNTRGTFSRCCYPFHCVSHSLHWLLVHWPFTKRIYVFCAITLSTPVLASTKGSRRPTSFVRTYSRITHDQNITYSLQDERRRIPRSHG